MIPAHSKLLPLGSCLPRVNTALLWALGCCPSSLYLTHGVVRAEERNLEPLRTMEVAGRLYLYF